jgi:site-specific DNA-methyltransferase (adenine-specific)
MHDAPSLPQPYYSDDSVALYHGKFEEILPTLGITADLIVTDPPYGETSLDWDVWPKGWPSLAAQHARAMWCFGSMRMFLNQRDEFTDWRLSQDAVWEKQDGSGFTTDRLRRVHEHALHWYRGDWASVHHETPRTGHIGPDESVRRIAIPSLHHGDRGESQYVDNGTRLLRSVIYAPNMHGKNPTNETEKPERILEPLIEYGCPVGGLVLDLFAGSSSTLRAARNTGRRAVGIEMREEQCEKAAQRLSQGILFGGVA